MLGRFKTFMAGIDASIAEKQREVDAMLDKANLEAQVQQSTSIKTEEFQSKLEEEVNLEAAESERLRQSRLGSTLAGDRLLAALFGMASDRVRTELGSPATISQRRIWDEGAMKMAMQDRQLLERLRDPSYRSAYEESAMVMGGTADHYESIAALLDGIEVYSSGPEGSPQLTDESGD